MEKRITVKEYAELRGITTGAVRKAIKLGHTLQNVERREKFGKSHVIYVTEAWIKRQKKYFKNN